MVRVQDVFMKIPTDFILAGHSAAAQHDLCADSMSVTEFLGTSVFHERVGTVVYTEVLYFDEKNVQTIPGTTLRYTGLFQTVMDMIHSGNDVARTDEALEQLQEDGKLDDFIDYCREHGLPESELEFGLAGLE